MARTGASAETVISSESAPKLEPRLQVRLGGPIASQPIIVGEVAYVGSWDGYEYAIDLRTGVVKWRTFLGRTTNASCEPAMLGVTSSASAVDGVLYVGGGDAFWYALDATNGAVRWRIPTGDNSAAGGHYNWSSPLVWGGAAYIGIASDCDAPKVHGQLLRVDLVTHKVTARFDSVPRGQAGGGIWQSPSVDPATQTIFVVTGNHSQPLGQPLAQSIVALDATTLAVRSHWQTPPAASIPDGDWGTTPILLQDRLGRDLVASANKNGKLYAFLRKDLAAGPVWVRQVATGGSCPTCGQGTVSSPTLGDGRLYIAGGRSIVAGQSRNGTVRALDPISGTVLWERGFDHAVIAALTYVNGMVIAGVGPDLIVLDARDGSVLFSHHTGPETFGPPSVAEGMVFIGSVDGTFWGFGLPSTV